MLFGTLLLSISLSIDALGIGSSYGMRRIKIPASAKIIVAVLSILVTSLSLFLGQGLSRILPVSYAQNAGIFILVLMGFWIIWQGFREESSEEETPECTEQTILDHFIRSLGITIRIIRTPQSCDMDGSSSIDPLEALYLGFALSIDSLGAGLGSGAAGLISPVIPIMAAVFQVLFLTLGSRLGARLLCFSKIKSKTWVVLSGLLLILLGILRMFA